LKIFQFIRLNEILDPDDFTLVVKAIYPGTMVLENQSPVGRLFFVSFSVDRNTRSSSVDLLSVEEGERLECLDADNPDRWVIARPPSGFLGDSSIEARGRGNAVCMLTHSPAKLSQGGNTREQFREEVLNISNKKQESSIKQKCLKRLFKVFEIFVCSPRLRLSSVLRRIKFNSHFYRSMRLSMLAGKSVPESVMAAISSPLSILGETITWRFDSLSLKPYALTEIIDLEEGYGVRVKRLERLLASLTGNILEGDKITAFPAEMQLALEGLQLHLSATVKLSEKLRAQMQMCAMNPTAAAQCFLDLEPEFAHYTAYLLHLSHLMCAYEKISTQKQDICFELTPITGTPPPSTNVATFNMDVKGIGSNGTSENRIGARQFLEQLFIPQAHLTSYESLLGYLARYAARSHKPTRKLEAAMAVVRQASRRAVELQQLWPFVVDMPSELGSLPPKGAVIQDLEQLPKPVVRLTNLKINRRKGGRLKPEDSTEGFLLLDPNYLIFLTEQSEAMDSPMYAVAWKIPLSDLRIRQSDQKEMENTMFELWDVGHSEDSIKSIVRVEAGSALSAETWLQDLEKSIKSQGVNPFLDKEAMEAHETADLESRKRYSQLVELDDWTEGENQFSELYYDVDELVQSIDGGIYDPDIILHQLTSVEGEDETSLTYYSAEGSMQHIETTDKRKNSSQNVRPANSVGTVDEVPNPFLEQKSGDWPEELTNEVVLTQSVSADKPFEHHAELQNINSSEGGELELTISTSSSEDETFTASWTFEGQPLSSSLGAQTQTTGGNVTLSVPYVTKIQHEGRYECTLVWPGGMRAVFPFQVKVHPAEDDVALTNDSSQQLRVRTIEQASVTVTQQYDEEDDSYAGSKGILIPRKGSTNTLGVVEVSTVPDETQVATTAIVSSTQHPGAPRKAGVSTGAVKTYYTTSASVHSVEQDHAVPHGETAPEMPTSVKPQIVQNTAQLKKVITCDIDFKQHTPPQRLVFNEGDKLLATLFVQLDRRTLREAKVFWTKDGKTVATAGVPVRTNKTDFTVSVKQEASGKTAEINLMKAITTQEDAGEYILWVEPKGSRFGPKQEAKEWGRIRVMVEKKPVLEGKEEEQAPESIKEIVEEIELTGDSSRSAADSDQDSKHLEAQGDKREQKETETDKVGQNKTAEEAEAKPQRKKSSGDDQMATDDAQSKTSVSQKEAEEAALRTQKTADVQNQSEKQKKEKIFPKAIDEVEVVEKVKKTSEASAKDTKAAEDKEEKPKQKKKQSSVTETEQPGEAGRKVEIGKEKEDKEKKPSAGKEEQHKTRKASRDETTVVDGEHTRTEVKAAEAAALLVEETPAKPKSSAVDEKHPSDNEPKTLTGEVGKETADADKEDETPEKPKKERKTGAAEKQDDEKKEKKEKKLAAAAAAAAGEANRKEDRLEPKDELNKAKEEKDEKTKRTAEEKDENRKKKEASKEESTVPDGEKVKPEVPSTKEAAEKPTKPEKAEKPSKNKEVKAVVEPAEQPAGSAEKEPKPAEKPEEAEKKVTEKKPVEAEVDKDTNAENLIKLAVGEKLKLTALANLDMRQLKTSNVYWTKDGKQIADLNFAPRAATFMARYLPKPPRATEVDLVKKTAVEVEDSGTYCLMSEPKIKSMRNNQPTQHALFQVVVASSPPAGSEAPECAPDEMKVEESKEVPVVTHPKDREPAIEGNDKETAPNSTASTATPDGAAQKPTEVAAEVPDIANGTPAESKVDYLKLGETSAEVAEVLDASEVAPREKTELSTDKDVYKVCEIPTAEEEDGRKLETKPKKPKKPKKHREKTSQEEKVEVRRVSKSEAVGIDTAVASKPLGQPPTQAIRCVELDAMRMMGDESVVVDEGQPICLTVVGLPEECEGLQWTRNGIHMLSSDPSGQFRPPFSSLSHPGEVATQMLIKAASPEDAGVYELTAGKRLGTRINEHKLAIRRRDPLSLVFAQAVDCDHHFNWEGTEVVALASTKQAREFL
uniref:Dedicator of cytokinesis 6 n=1 Tax=Schistocephalus solidus TaxID=70667 RepID=A0A183SN63_SCHSO